MSTTPDFWRSPEGLQIRTEDLAQMVTWQTVNEAMQLLGKGAGAYGSEWVTEIDNKTCNYCDSQSGRIYKRGQFMPTIPAHPNCRCFWSILFSRE